MRLASISVTLASSTANESRSKPKNCRVRTSDAVPVARRARSPKLSWIFVSNFHFEVHELSIGDVKEITAAAGWIEHAELEQIVRQIA